MFRTFSKIGGLQIHRIDSCFPGSTSASPPFSKSAGPLVTGLGCNGFDDASTVGLGMFGAVLVEIILTCFFVLTILGVTADGKASPFAGIVIGLTLIG